MPANRRRYPPPAVAIPSPPAGCLVPGLPLPQARRSREITPPSAAHPARRSREIDAAICGSPSPPFTGDRRRHLRLTQPAVHGRSPPPSAAHPGPPFAGDHAAGPPLTQASRPAADSSPGPVDQVHTSRPGVPCLCLVVPTGTF